MEHELYSLNEDMQTMPEDLSGLKISNVFIKGVWVLPLDLDFLDAILLPR